jgi:hypothetical protein
MSNVRRYAIEVSDVETDQIVFLTAADWTEEQKRVALAQIMRLPGLPDEDCLIKPAAPRPKRALTWKGNAVTLRRPR